MPDHARKQIRDAVKAALLGLPTSGSRVEVGRTRSLAAGHQPTLLVYLGKEAIQRGAMGRPPIIDRSLQLFVECRVVSSEPPDELLDAMAKEVEPAMATDPRLGGKVNDVRPVGNEFAADADGTKHNGGLRLEYLIVYRTPANDPTTFA